MKSCKCHLRVAWFFQWVAAAILAQTLFFKFTGAAESRFIFTALGVEPWGRFATGLLELVAVVLLLTPRWAAWGGMLSLGLMSGAILGHLTRLGLVVRNDGGLLFGLAITVFLAAAGVVWLRRFQLPFLKDWAPGECRV